MTTPDTTPIPEVSTDRFRSYLRGHLDAVLMHSERFVITRRGQPVAGLVPAHEARALWRLQHSTAAYSEWKMMHRLNEERAMRLAVMEEARTKEREGYGG